MVCRICYCTASACKHPEEHKDTYRRSAQDDGSYHRLAAWAKASEHEKIAEFRKPRKPQWTQDLRRYSLEPYKGETYED